MYTKVSNELLGPVSEAVNTTMLIPFFKKMPADCTKISLSSHLYLSLHKKVLPETAKFA